MLYDYKNADFRSGFLAVGLGVAKKKRISCKSYIHTLKLIFKGTMSLQERLKKIFKFNKKNIVWASNKT